MKVIILRGTPGSGKSSWCIKNNIDKNFICSGDKYFQQKDGTYKFNKSKLNTAHKECVRDFIKLCHNNWNITNGSIVVDNTNTYPLEMAPYIAIANAYDIEVEIIRFNCSIKTSIDRNVHNVPEETIVRMWQKMQKKQFPSWWPKETIIETD